MNCWPMPAQKECQLSWSSRQPSEVRIDESLYFLGRRRLPSLASSIEAEGYNLRYSVEWCIVGSRGPDESVIQVGSQILLKEA